VLHSNPDPIFHRDIRWPNVMQQVADHTKWFLIDWEDASAAPTRAAPKLKSYTHAPQVFKDGHGAEVDIWGVGKLIMMNPISGLPPSLLDLGSRMINGKIVTAAQGLKELRSIDFDYAAMQLTLLL